jgi:hypothetical protein
MCHLTHDNSQQADPMEGLLTLREFRARLPKRNNGQRVDLNTVYRWVSRGINGVRLRTVKVGGVMYTTMEWAWEFLNRDQRPGTTTAPSPSSAEIAPRPQTPARSPAQDRRALEAARRRLAERGLIRLPA